MAFIIHDNILQRYSGDETEIYIPDGVTAIDRSAFSLCHKIERILIPAGLTGNVYCDMAQFYALREFVVSDDNPEYSSRDGLLYNKNQTRLIRCPIAREGHIDVADTVTEIGDGAFRYCDVKTVGLPAGLKRIGDTAFSGCPWLDRVTVPDGVEHIGSCAFSECGMLRYIYLPAQAEIEDEELLVVNSFSKMEIDGRGGYFYGIDYSCL